MKHLIAVASALVVSSMSYAQLQFSVSSGYAISSAGMKLGETVNASERENVYGSYGEGANIQIRGTYFFNESLGVDLGLGYLHGVDFTKSEVNLPNLNVDAVARARAFGASTSLVYKFNDAVYGRIGALVKVGGKTEAVVYQKSIFTEQEATAFGVPVGSYSETNYKEDFHGHFPLGFVAALGYKYNLTEHLGLFIEAEYYGISLRRKDSEISEFNTNIVLPDGTVAVDGFYSLDNLPDGYVKETTYVDNLSNTNTDTSKKLSEKVPYSSFGINFGIVFNLKRRTKNN
ncbi:hypothetical protein EGM88_07340 [Aureibaculum marinum]|uniref:Outer membrane protein beta-barrel domain-containing protein n=1 Tax=Aureibaculum marinum TaxID=2487930 RepID=A0A3N4NNW6_9FLAO|nr:outer membrane beta-barrel protein [Aureibaculum marinum]RPD97971.1 hypothetical protein EGM88_07340 [Aureibaculum marinum]